MVTPKTIPQIRTESPFPWREAMRANQVFVVDAAGKEVPLFSVTAFVEQITAHLASQPVTPK